jgi:hypothetical protein
VWWVLRPRFQSGVLFLAWEARLSSRIKPTDEVREIDPNAKRE